MLAVAVYPRHTGRPVFGDILVFCFSFWHAGMKQGQVWHGFMCMVGMILWHGTFYDMVISFAHMA